MQLKNSSGILNWDAQPIMVPILTEIEERTFIRSILASSDGGMGFFFDGGVISNREKHD